jgi:hypothetical protein
MNRKIKGKTNGQRIGRQMEKKKKWTLMEKEKKWTERWKKEKKWTHRPMEKEKTWTERQMEKEKNGQRDR